jgi:hypothetical protein
MEAVQSEGVAVEGAEGVLLTGCAGIRIRAVVSPKASLSKAATEQSRDNSWSTYAGVSQSRVHLLSKISDFPRKLNRQIAELETTLTPRKQRSANCSNRQKIQFRESQNPSPVFATPSPVPLSRTLVRRVLVTSRLLAPTKEGPLACPDEGRATVLSNRELLVLETLQPADNKHRPTVLIENFEPNCTPQPQGRSK